MTNVTKTANEYFLTQAQFNERKQAGTLEVGAVYHITDVHSQDMFIKVYTTTTMNTSTLPTIAVPELTAEQVATIQTAKSQGKEVTIDATHNGITNQLTVLESDHDGSIGGIRVTYYNNYVDYTLDGNQVTATYIPIGSEGGKLYQHIMNGNSTGSDNVCEVYLEYYDNKPTIMSRAEFFSWIKTNFPRDYGTVPHGYYPCKGTLKKNGVFSHIVGVFGSSTDYIYVASYTPQGEYSEASCFFSSNWTRSVTIERS